MKTYKIAYSYVSHGEVTVEAESLEQAKEFAYEASFNADHEYLDEASFDIDEERTNVLNSVHNIVC